MPDAPEAADLMYVQPAARSRDRGLPAIGFRMVVPPGVELLDPPAETDVLITAIERSGGAGAVQGELVITGFTAPLLLDAPAILRSLAESAAASLLDPPGRARLHPAAEIDLAGRRAWRIDAEIECDHTGEAPPCPHASLVAMGHARPATGVGLLVVLLGRGRPWASGERMLSSLDVLASDDSATT